MEKNSTTRAALLPRAANLATLAVVMAATWWSGAQRPIAQPALAGGDQAGAVEVADARLQRPATALTTSPTVAAATTTAAAVTWPAQAATTIARDGLQAVGYQTRAPR